MQGDFKVKRITVWRRRAGISPETMATLLGLSAADFTALERGEYGLTEADLYALEITFGGLSFKSILRKSDEHDAPYLAQMDAGFRAACKSWDIEA